MLVALPLLIAALLSGYEEESRRRYLEAALGLEKGSGGPGFQDWFVPIRVWGGGSCSIWKLVSREGLGLIRKEMSNIDPQELFQDPWSEVEPDYDPASYAPGGEQERALATNVDTYVLLEGTDLVAVFTCGVSSSEFRVQVHSGWILDDDDKYRIAFYLHDAHPHLFDEAIDALRPDSFVGPPELMEAVEAVDVVLRQHGMNSPELKHLRALGRGPSGRWVDAYVTLLEANEELTRCSDDYRQKARSSPRDWVDTRVGEGNLTQEEIEDAVLDRIGMDRDGVDPDDLEDLVEKHLERTYYASWEADVEDASVEVSQAMRWLMSTVRAEILSGGQSLPDLSEDIEEQHNGLEVTIQRAQAPRNEEPVDMMILSVDEHDGEPTWEMRNRTTPKDEVGLIHQLRAARLLLTAEEARALAGAPTWTFPGPLEEEWSLFSTLGIYHVTGGEPVPLLVQIAAQHGLLSDRTAAAWTPALETRPESSTWLEKLRLLDPR